MVEHFGAGNGWGPDYQRFQRVRHQRYELLKLQLVRDRTSGILARGDLLMLARFFLAALIGIGAYVGALLVERASSATSTKVEVIPSDPWQKLKQELAVRRQISLSRKTEGGSHSLAHDSNSKVTRLQVDSEKNRIDDDTNAERRLTPRAEPNLRGLPAGLLNPNFAESAKEKVADLGPSSGLPTEAIAIDREKPIAEKSLRRKRSIVKRQEDGSSHAGRGDSTDLASRRPPSRDSMSKRYEQSARDYRDLRDYMLR
jgi:hypothetical protein